jgi:hypothetical protein
VILRFQPGPLKEFERCLGLIWQDRLYLQDAAPANAVHEVAATVAGLPEHAKEIESRTMSKEGQLRHETVIVNKAAISHESSSENRRDRRNQALKVLVRDGKVRVQGVMLQNRALTCPAEQEPAPYPVVAIKRRRLERIAQILQVRYEALGLSVFENRKFPLVGGHAHGRHM